MLFSGGGVSVGLPKFLLFLPLDRAGPPGHLTKKFFWETSTPGVYRGEFSRGWKFRQPACSSSRLTHRTLAHGDKFMKVAMLPETLESGIASHLLDPEIRVRVAQLLSRLFPQGYLPERRQDQRYPFPFLVRLNRVAADGQTPTEESIVVVGKHISESGFGFYHFQPLTDRRMIASFETPSGQWIAFLLDIRWCRFTQQGWYESGGRFLRAVACPPYRPE